MKVSHSLLRAIDPDRSPTVLTDRFLRPLGSSPDWISYSPSTMIDTYFPIRPSETCSLVHIMLEPNNASVQQLLFKYIP